MAHSVSPAPRDSTAGAEEPSVGTLVQSAMADISTLCAARSSWPRPRSASRRRRPGIGAGAFGAAGVVLAFSGFFFGIALRRVPHLAGPRALDLLRDRLVPAGAPRRSGLALVGRRFIKKIEKPERTLETLSDLPEVLHREAPGQRHRAVPEVSNGKVVLRGNESYKV